MTKCHTLCRMIFDLLIAATYVVQLLGYAAMVLGIVWLAIAGGRS